jgi:hypothetical protein
LEEINAKTQRRKDAREEEGWGRRTQRREGAKAQGKRNKKVVDLA